MNRNVGWFLIVSGVTAVLQVGWQRYDEALVIDYKLPPRVAQEVAGIAFGKYSRVTSWEDAYHTFFVCSADKKIEVAHLIGRAPVLPRVVYLPYSEGAYMQTREDYDARKLKRIVTIGEVRGTWKRVYVGIGTYFGPLGVESMDFILERRWWGWAIVDTKSYAIARAPSRERCPTSRHSQRRDLSRRVLPYPIRNETSV